MPKSKKTLAAKKAVHAIDNGMISKIITVRAEYNSSGRSVASVTIATVDGNQHTFNVALPVEVQEDLKHMVGNVMRGLPFGPKL